MQEDNNDQLKAIARLEVQLQTVLDRLTDVSSNMVTKDLYTAQNQNVEYRFRTVEDQLTTWRAESVASHVELEASSKARHEEAKRLAAEAATEARNEASKHLKNLENRIDKADERAFQVEQAQEAQKNGRLLQYSLAGLSFILSIAGGVIIALLGNTITPPAG